MSDGWERGRREDRRRQRQWRSCWPCCAPARLLQHVPGRAPLAEQLSAHGHGVLRRHLPVRPGAADVSGQSGDGVVHLGRREELGGHEARAQQLHHHGHQLTEGRRARDAMTAPFTQRDERRPSACVVTRRLLLTHVVAAAPACSFPPGSSSVLSACPLASRRRVFSFPAAPASPSSTASPRPPARAPSPAPLASLSPSTTVHVIGGSVVEPGGTGRATATCPREHGLQRGQVECLIGWQQTHRRAAAAARVRALLTG